jgi:hypothetical protein
VGDFAPRVRVTSWLAASHSLTRTAKALSSMSVISVGNTEHGKPGGVG